MRASKLIAQTTSRHIRIFGRRDVRRITLLAGCMLIGLIAYLALVMPEYAKYQAQAKPLPINRFAAATGPLRVDPANPRYFTDGSGRAIYLTGSHTWDARQDMGTHLFDYERYLTL